MLFPRVLLLLISFVTLVTSESSVIYPFSYEENPIEKTEDASTATSKSTAKKKEETSTSVESISTSSKESKEPDFVQTEESIESKISPTLETTPDSTTEQTPTIETEPSVVEEQQNPAPAPAPVQHESNQTPVIEETTSNPSPAPNPPAGPPVMQAMMLNIGGSYIPYSNAGQGSGQSVIDSNSGIGATWGGAAVQSGNDGMNTHFIGHNPGAFSALFSVGAGSAIQVSDGAGQVTSYTVQYCVTVDDNAYGSNGVDYWDQMIGSGGGERITLQTCINDSTNLVVFASK
ncbi:hypothetical protein NRIC_04790 [Enterococcus florum]|uniref:Sortase n=1 Tax=Enterococcus florum TaxID=2480627 RepID=A0A4P5P9E4_9ENTE|nr:sortase [Enterococcus florum]GCF92588.1 hypothetical protein NRIC_04790 [Enterococcus florum]